MKKLHTAIGAAALLCASQADAAYGVYYEREPNNTIQQAEKIDFAFAPNDAQFIVNFFGSLDTDTNFGADWFAFSLPMAAANGVFRYNISIYVESLVGASNPDIVVFNQDTNRVIENDFSTAVGGRYAVGVLNRNATAGGFYRANVVIDAIPEPTTWVLMLAGFGMVGYSLRRRRAQMAFA